MSRFRSPWTWVILAALLLAGVFIFDVTPWVRGGFGWRWEYQPLARPVIGYVLLLASYAVIVWRLLSGAANARLVLALAFVASIVFPLVAVGLRESDALRGLTARTFSVVASAHQWGAANIDWASGEWRDWTAVMARLGSHLSTSPPGQPLLYGLLTEGIDRFGLSTALARPLVTALCTDYALFEMTPAQVASGWLGVLSPVWAALTVFPLYSLARRLGARADVAVLLWPIVPALSGFTPSSSTVFPLLAVLIFLPLTGTPSRRGIALSGFLYSLATFINFAMLPLAAMFALFTTLRWLLTGPRTPASAILRDMALFALSACLPWGIWFVVTGLTPLDVLEQALAFHLALERLYIFWVWFHIWDWSLWSGGAIAVVAVLAGVGLWRIRSERPAAAAFAITLALTLAAITISGMTRGESGRIWMFMTPFLLVVAATPLPGAAMRQRWRMLITAQVILTFAMIFAIDAFNAPDVPARPTMNVSRLDMTPLATFTSEDSGQFSVLSAGVYEPGLLTLEIVGEMPTLAPVWFGVIAVDAMDESLISPAGPQQPTRGGERMPSTCWTPESATRVTLVLPPLDPIRSDEFYVSLSAYGWNAGDAALTVTTPHSTGVQVGLGPFRVAQSRLLAELQVSNP